ncbi:hypothetical protein Rcas_1873 [Roseiflexus castenholzii DSM 13941]|uniref:Uncharacterized protein n=1 Tax=Roseiflexus castenholzii (strain DSM 13941 / HLO8) TaxID=383372 RepID=A7NKE4_ROSCS|nr:hypothetical protein Rcas_1873 [Roseiflexus castenholzii DSM 13941]
MRNRRAGVNISLPEAHHRSRSGQMQRDRLPGASPGFRAQRIAAGTPDVLAVQMPATRVVLDVVPDGMQSAFVAYDVVVIIALPDWSARCAGQCADSFGDKNMRLVGCNRIPAIGWIGGGVGCGRRMSYRLLHSLGM